MNKKIFEEAENYSLLWKQNDRSYFQLTDSDFLDLNLTHCLEIIREQCKDFNKEELLRMPIKEETVLYRQAILEDLVNNPDLVEDFMWVQGRTTQRLSLVKFAFEGEHTVYNLLKRVEESREVMTIVDKLYEALKVYSLQSEGLRNLFDLIHGIIHSPLYVNFNKDMEQIEAMNGEILSIKIGMNFDENLSPKAGVILSMGTEKVKVKKGLRKSAKGFLDLAYVPVNILPKLFGGAKDPIPDEDLNALEVLTQPAFAQLIKFCDNFNDTLLHLMNTVLKDMSFYIGMKGLYDVFKDNEIKCSKPELSDYLKMDKICNVNLMCKMIKEKKVEMVYNNIEMKDGENCFIFTGANRGGKTTTTQALGQMILLAQHGFLLPGQVIKIPLCSGIHMIFPREENMTVTHGRLGEECNRFSEIFDKVNNQSLVLLNETFSGTSHLESLVMAKECMKALALIGCKVLFNTHLHELCQTLTDDDTDHIYTSLVTGSIDDPNSFEIRRTEALGKSYAKEIAVKYGVSYEQLMS